VLNDAVNTVFESPNRSDWKLRLLNTLDISTAFDPLKRAQY